eukprot:1372225-Rhodomonas_salina.1
MKAGGGREESTGDARGEVCERKHGEKCVRGARGEVCERKGGEGEMRREGDARESSDAKRGEEVGGRREVVQT